LNAGAAGGSTGESAPAFDVIAHFTAVSLYYNPPRVVIVDPLKIKKYGRRYCWNQFVIDGLFFLFFLLLLYIN
jgi:hypothetical protein